MVWWRIIPLLPRLRIFPHSLPSQNSCTSLTERGLVGVPEEGSEDWRRPVWVDLQLCTEKHRNPASEHWGCVCWPSVDSSVQGWSGQIFWQQHFFPLWKEPIIPPLGKEAKENGGYLLEPDEMPCYGHRWDTLPYSPGCPNKELASKCFSSAGILFVWIWDGTQNVKL